MGKLYFIDLVYTISDNTLEQESRIPCTSKHNFTFDDCLYRKIHGAMMKKFGCTVAFLPPNSSSDFVCRDKNETEIGDFMKFYGHISSNGQRNFCQMPCSTMEVSSLITLEYLITVHTAKSKGVIPFTCWAFKLILDLGIYHQFNNIKLSFFTSHMKSSFPLCTFNRCCTVIRYSRVPTSS